MNPGRAGRVTGAFVIGLIYWIPLSIPGDEWNFVDVPEHNKSEEHDHCQIHFPKSRYLALGPDDRESCSCIHGSHS